MKNGDNTISGRRSYIYFFIPAISKSQNNTIYVFFSVDYLLDILFLWTHLTVIKWFFFLKTEFCLKANEIN